MKLYKEENVSFKRSLYSTNRELVLDTGERLVSTALTRNICKCKVANS